MKKTYSILLTLIITIGFISGSVEEVLGQPKYKGYIVSEELIIGKKYNGKISDTAIARINTKMEEIKALIKKSCTSNDSLELNLNYITDVNNLKSIEMCPPSFAGERETTVPSTLALLKILKKYPYIDVMVTALAVDQESADGLVNSAAMDLYNNGLEKERMRVNGLVGKIKTGRDFMLIFEIHLQLVPSKEMIDKAINGTL